MQSHSDTKDYSNWSGSETGAQGKLHTSVCTAGMVSSHGS